MDGEPDEGEVQELHVGDAEREAQYVDQCGRPGQGGEGGPAVALVQLQQRRGEGDHGEVDPDEPQRLGDEPQRGPGQRSAAVAGELHGERGRGPHQDEDEGGAQQPLEPGPQEAGVDGPVGAAGQGAVGQGVREPADEEEDGHDLQPPGERLEGGHEGEQIPYAVAADGGHQPVSGDDGAERGDAQQVDVPVTVGGGGLGQGACASCHGATVSPAGCLPTGCGYSTPA